MTNEIVPEVMEETRNSQLLNQEEIVSIQTDDKWADKKTAFMTLGNR